MSKFSQFSSENLLMSIGGHLALVAVMVTSIAIVIDRAQMVTPDRVQIMEIDLNAVKITGDETRLHNVDAAVAPEQEKTPDVAQPKPVPEPVATPDVPDAPIETPSLVEETEKPADQKPESAAAEKPQETPAPKKKTVVRVNREVVSLDRTLTVSVVDALRVAMTRCWTIDTNYPGIEDIRAVAHLTMRRNGTVRDVWFESASRADSDPAFAYVLQTIRDAINVCQPLKMLPANEFAKWEKIQLTFYPTQGKVM